MVASATGFGLAEGAGDDLDHHILVGRDGGCRLARWGRGPAPINHGDQALVPVTGEEARGGTERASLFWPGALVQLVVNPKSRLLRLDFFNCVVRCRIHLDYLIAR